MDFSPSLSDAYQSPLPEGEGQGEGEAVAEGPPHPAYGHLLPQGEGTRSWCKVPGVELSVNVLRFLFQYTGRCDCNVIMLPLNLLNVDSSWLLI